MFKLGNSNKYLQTNQKGVVLTQLPPNCRIYASVIGSDNGLSPIRRQAIIWTSSGLLSIGHFGTNFSEILIHENESENIACEKDDVMMVCHSKTMFVYMSKLSIELHPTNTSAFHLLFPAVCMVQNITCRKALYSLNLIQKNIIAMINPSSTTVENMWSYTSREIVIYKTGRI